MMKGLTTLWKGLLQISQLNITSVCRRIPPSFERREGKGKVILQDISENSITTFEKGQWQGVHAKETVAFTNVFRWQVDWEKERLSLEHLRFGTDRPVFLFYLIPVEDHLLKSLEPHECKEDTYFGSVLFDDHYIHLNWRVVGPKKNETTQMVYS